MIHYLWKISGAKAQKSDAVLREDFCGGNLVSDRAMTGGNSVKESRGQPQSGALKQATCKGNF